MKQSWRVIINKKLYDFEGFKRSKQTTIYQSKGNAKMKHCPKQNDNVCFVIQGKIVMRGIVTREFQVGAKHTDDMFNIEKQERIHEKTPEYATCKIIEILDEPIPIARSGQRTWARI